MTHRDAREHNGDGEMIEWGDVVGGDDAAGVVSVLAVLLSHHQAQDRVKDTQHKTKISKSTN